MRFRVHLRTEILLRHAVFAVAFLTYLLDPVDIVWRFVRTSARPRLNEHLSFGAAALLLAIATLLSRRDDARQRPKSPQLLFALAIASLLPLAGAVVLTCGEALRLTLSTAAPDAPGRKSIVYITACLAMTLFAFTLQDRQAEVLFALTFLVVLWADFAPTRQRP